MAGPPPEISVPLRWQATPDGRSRGTFTQFARDFVAQRPEGATRDELIEASGAAQLFRLPGSRKGLVAAIARLLRTGDLIESGGRLRPARQVRPTPSEAAGRKSRGKHQCSSARTA